MDGILLLGIALMAIGFFLIAFGLHLRRRIRDPRVYDPEKESGPREEDGHLR